MKTIQIISPKEIHNIATEHGWWDKKREVPELLCLIHSEISEALEAYRNDLSPSEKGWLGEELADAVIRIFDMSEFLEIDIAEQVALKCLINKSRPYRHGNKKC